MAFGVRVSKQRAFNMVVSLEKPIDQLADKILQRAYMIEGMDVQGFCHIEEVPFRHYEVIKRPRFELPKSLNVVTEDMWMLATRDNLSDEEVETFRLIITKELHRRLQGYDLAGILSDYVKGHAMPLSDDIRIHDPTSFQWKFQDEDDSVFWPSIDHKRDTIKENYPHYHKKVKGLNYLDVYRVLSLFCVTDPCIQHAIKKLLVAGGRGNKAIDKDVHEAIVSLQRWEEMRDEENPF